MDQKLLHISKNGELVSAYCDVIVAEYIAELHNRVAVLAEALTDLVKSAASVEQSCRVKLLEWDLINSGDTNEHWSAETPIGKYTIGRCCKCGFHVLYHCGLYDTLIADDADSIESAKVAAQRHFDNLWHEMTIIK